MATVDTLMVRIEADMSELKRGLDKVQRDVDKSSRGMGRAFARIGTAFKAAVAAVVVKQAARAGGALIGLASDIEEMQGKSKVVFGAFRDQVVADLEEFGDQVGRATHELEGMASSIQDTFVPMGFARGEAAKLSVELTKLAVDVASFNNASDTETMEAFQSALVGNHETVRRFGVVITEATLNQELMRMGIEKGTKAATNAEKVQARLNLITRGTSDAHGDAARTADSFANQTRALKAQVAELAGELGTILLPAATAIIGAFIEGTKRAKEFLQSMGILSMPIDEALIATRAEIEATQKVMDNLKSGIEGISEAASSGDIYAQAADTSVLQSQLEAATEKMNKLIEKRNELTSQQLDIVPPSTAISGGAAEPETDPENDPETVKLKAQRKALDELKSSSYSMFQLQKRLDIARHEGNKEQERQILTTLALRDLQKQFPDLTKAELDGLAKQTAMRQMANDERREELSLREAAAQKAADEAAALKERLANMTPMQDTYLQSVQTMASGVSNAFADMLTSGKMNMNSLKDVFRSFVKTMIAKAIELFIVNKIMASVFGLPSTTLSSGATVLGKVATGGTVQPNKPYLVGERGPELIVPSSASTVMNAHNTRNALKGGGGPVVNQTINISAGVAQTVKAEMLSMLPQIKADTMRSVADANMRGGSYRRSLA